MRVKRRKTFPAVAWDGTTDALGKMLSEFPNYSFTVYNDGTGDINLSVGNLEVRPGEVLVKEPEGICTYSAQDIELLFEVE